MIAYDVYLTMIPRHQYTFRGINLLNTHHSLCQGRVKRIIIFWWTFWLCFYKMRSGPQDFRQLSSQSFIIWKMREKKSIYAIDSMHYQPWIKAIKGSKAWKDARWILVAPKRHNWQTSSMYNSDGKNTQRWRLSDFFFSRSRFKTGGDTPLRDMIAIQLSLWIRCVCR